MNPVKVTIRKKNVKIQVSNQDQGHEKQIDKFLKQKIQ